METIYDLLKYPYGGIRISSGGPAWLTFDEDNETWIVYSKPYRARNTKVIYQGTDEKAAVAAFAKENNMHQEESEDES